MWSHSVVEHLLCEVMCLGVRDGAAETLLTGVKVVPETTYLGKSSIGDDIAHIGDYLCLFVFLTASPPDDGASRGWSLIAHPGDSTAFARPSPLRRGPWHA